MKRLITALAAIGACAGMLTVAEPAYATAELDFNHGGFVINDNDANDSCKAVGVVCFIGMVGGFDVSVTTGRSFSPNGAEGIDLSFTALGSGTINIQFGDNNFAGGVGTIQALSSIGGTLGVGGGICWQSRIDSNNVQPPGGGNQFGAQICKSSPPSSFSGSNVDLYTTSGPFQLFQGVTITQRSGLTTGDYSVKIVPEPATLGLLGIALVGIAFARRKSV